MSMPWRRVVVLAREAVRDLPDAMPPEALGPQTYRGWVPGAEYRPGLHIDRVMNDLKFEARLRELQESKAAHGTRAWEPPWVHRKKSS